ncbi:mannose-binding protein A [Microcaecilia unicolor]|uniref:Mannose-binding protein A-like n=1 Tax=Microcaecilia unicolor TaxID=1415580 RepID=A0A6P7YCG6_9AMPH|nr:mannose-binding protein A-like [Microcaecilia unicolor]
MQSLQLSVFLMLGMFIIIATSSPNPQSSTEKDNTCSMVACGAAGANGLPGRDGRDGREGPKGEKGDLGLQGSRGLQGPPGKAGPAGPAGLKGDKGSMGTKGEKGSSEDNGMQLAVRLMNEQLRTLQDNFNKFKKIFIFSIGKEVGRKIFVTNGLEYDYETASRMCSRAGGLVASPKNADENLALQEIVSKHDKRSFLGITDLHTEGTFKYSTGGTITYSNWHSNEPNNDKGNEDCVELNTDGKWNDTSCTNKKLLICEF